MCSTDLDLELEITEDEQALDPGPQRAGGRVPGVAWGQAGKYAGVAWGQLGRQDDTEAPDTEEEASATR